MQFQNALKMYSNGWEIYVNYHVCVFVNVDVTEFNYFLGELETKNSAVWKAVKIPVCE